MVEDGAYAAFVARIMRAFTARASTDPETLPLMAQVHRDAETALWRAATACHDGGYSYAEIAARLGVSKQYVHQRISRQRELDGQSDHGASTA